MNYAALEKLAFAKQAQNAAGSGVGSDIWGALSSWIDQAKAWYNDPKNKAWQPLVGAGIGALGLGGISKLLGGDFWPGAAIGGLGGVAATQFDWNALSDALGSKKPDGQQTPPPPQKKN